MRLFVRYLGTIETRIKEFCSFVKSCLTLRVYLGRHISRVPKGSLIFFPYTANLFFCGIAGIIAYKHRKSDAPVSVSFFKEALEKIQAFRFQSCRNADLKLSQNYLGGKSLIDTLKQSARTLKNNEPFYDLFRNPQAQQALVQFAGQLSTILEGETKLLDDHMGRLEFEEVETCSRRIDDLRDVHWCLTTEIFENIEKIKKLFNNAQPSPTFECLVVFKQINSVLNSIDRLEVRGRDSAGISLLFILEAVEFNKFYQTVTDNNLEQVFKNRSSKDVLVNQGISMNSSTSAAGDEVVALALTYKVAAEVGRLGDNVRFLRQQIKNDPIFQTLASFIPQYHTVSAHTRWASVGAITEPNCHPVDNKALGNAAGKNAIIHVCLNGDIDNYQDLKKEFERQGRTVPQEITTDTKIIPLQIEKYLRQGSAVEEAFRLAVNDFEGSHAISMHTDLAPGKFFLAQKGSGQAIFVGIAQNHFMPTSEVYGFVEETPNFIKLNGEKEIQGKLGKTKGQIFILDQESAGGLDGIQAMFYDGTPVELTEKDIKHTEITSRDIDRQEFPHYFLKEISESPLSVEKTLRNRWKIKDNGKQRHIVSLDQKIFPQRLQQALTEKRIRRIYFIGQGTAGIAAQACADIFNYYMHDPAFPISALKASELSGFKLNEHDDSQSMNDALVIAISQSGTTTDTNRAVDMVKERGAYTLAIVNRRDSDITFKVDGVMYTSSGRDIEMSVASTKAFYSQIVAGALLGLKIVHLLGLRNDDFVDQEIKQLLELPAQMKKVLSMRDKIEASAIRLAPTKTYWAAVGSGPNKSSADEIRIKLSELCYKTISSDYVEDKKHIDLSSEPLIIVCAAGARGTVIGDIIKDTAIFQAHKAVPVVIADEGENRFDAYAADVFHVPVVSEHFAPILNTLVGHIWGYYGALSINKGSSFFYDFRENIQKDINNYTEAGLSIYEIVLETPFREKIASFYREFRKKKAARDFPTVMGLEAASDLTLLLKYLSGRLPVSDFEIDFAKKGTALNMLDTLFQCLGESINCMARPVDAIKHQAKTVTVGTSRISEKVEGILFETLAHYNISLSQLINRNILVLKNIQEIVSHINGAIFYRIGGLSLLGELTGNTTIEVLKKDGVLKPIPSRVETDTKLKGTKRIIVGEGNVYIGKGRKDGRSILVIPIFSPSPATPNIIEFLLLLNISFKTEVPLEAKIKALGGKYERIKNIVQENSIVWNDRYLELIEIEDLFGISAEKIGDRIVSSVG